MGLRGVGLPVGVGQPAGFVELGRGPLRIVAGAPDALLRGDGDNGLGGEQGRSQDSGKNQKRRERLHCQVMHEGRDGHAGCIQLAIPSPRLSGGEAGGDEPRGGLLADGKPGEGEDGDVVVLAEVDSSFGGFGGVGPGRTEHRAGRS